MPLPISFCRHQCGSSLPLLSQYLYFAFLSFDFLSFFCSHVSLSLLHFSSFWPNLPRRPRFLFCLLFSPVLLVLRRGGGLLLPSIRRSLADEDLAVGVHELHKAGFMHRDIKLDICLVFCDGSRLRLRLSDLGSAASFVDAGGVNTAGVCASWYRAPELLVEPFALEELFE